MAEHCPTCGVEVLIRGGDEGTMRYEPVAARRLSELLDAIEAQIQAHPTAKTSVALRDALGRLGLWPSFTVEVESPFNHDYCDIYEEIGVEALSMRWEDLTGASRADSDDMAAALDAGEQDSFEWTDDESHRRTVTARRKEER